MRVAIIGATGFVGSAFTRLLSAQPGVDVIAVTRHTYAQAAGTASDVVIEAACNSRKFLADEKPLTEFEASVTHRLRTLLDFPARLHLHLSSVDVYADLSSPETTREDSIIDPARTSRYGFHKLLAEQLVQHYATDWLIVRLAGMVGPGLKKNPVFDVLRQQPLRIHPDSQYQFMHTDDVAAIVWGLVQQGFRRQIFNVCGQGLISLREIARLANQSLPKLLLPPDDTPRVVHISVKKVMAITSLPKTSETVQKFIQEHQAKWS